ncbi:hypothetical protein [Marinomonas sp.]
MNISTIVLLGSALILAGCQQTVRSSDTAEPAVEAKAELGKTVEVAAKPTLASEQDKVQVVESETKQAEVPAVKTLTAAEKITQRLIVNGRIALAEQRLLTPEDDNANLYFQAALGRDPGNFDAIQGISEIVEQYTQWAWSAAQKGQYLTAKRYLGFARLANPEDVLIVEVEGRIVDLKRTRTQQKTVKPVVSNPQSPPSIGEYSLPANLFSLSDEEIIERMQPIIDKVDETQAAIEINWPNDKQARLLYQIINSRVTEFRVRAMIFHRTARTIELQLD